MILDIIKVFLPAVLSFAFGIVLTPALTHYLYLHRMWKKRAGKTALDGTEAVLFNTMHKSRETGTPRLGGVIISAATVLSALTVTLIATLGGEALEQLSFLSRSQTWIPFAALLLGAFIGFIDDLLEIQGGRNGTYSGGLSLGKRLALIGIIGLICGWWFYEKLDVLEIGFPVIGPFFIEWLIIPLFALITVATYSGGIIDGLDGLAGGIFAIIFGAYGTIAFFQYQIDLAAFCAALLGGILAFLWFNIPPARFYMSETGSMALTITLAVTAFMTDSLGGGKGLIVLPIIAFPLVVTSGSVILQLIAKRFWGRRMFRIAPLHHHFEAIGWPPYKVVMRYWIFGVMTALLGVILGLVS